MQLTMRRSPTASLLAVTSSALTLPAYQAARSDAPPDSTEVGLRYSKYREDDITSDNAFGRGSERMEVDVAQFHLFTPIAREWAFALDVAWEDMSGASPWFVGESAGGDANVFMSGPSIRDTRTAVSVTTRYYYDRGNAGLNYTRSDEDDYESDAITVDGSLNSEDGMRTYGVSVSASDDTLDPTQGNTPTSTLGAEKDIRSAWVGVSQIISKRAIVRFGLSYTYRNGFLSDPYKANDSRPGTRKEWVLDSGYRHFLVPLNGAVQLDYRYFDDDWGIQSHTLDIAWHQNIGLHTRLIPYLRYYTQSESRFFANLVDFNDRYYSDDYRLSAFGAIATGLRVRYDIRDWSLSLGGERYRTDESWGAFSGEESPALVDAWRVSFGMDYSFR
jgi:hypothetical protein